MARIYGLPKGTKLNGSLGDFTFYNHNGKTFLRKRKSKSNKKAPSIQNLQFGLASTLTKNLRLALDQYYPINTSYTTHTNVCKVILSSIQIWRKFDPLKPLQLQDIKVKNNSYYFLSQQFFQLDHNSGNLNLDIPNQLLYRYFGSVPRPFDLLLKITTMSEENIVDGKFAPLHPSWHPHNFVQRLTISTFKPRKEAVKIQIKLIHQGQIIPAEVGIIVTMGITSKTSLPDGI